MPALSERIAKIRKAVDQQDSLMYSLLTPRQVKEWKDDEHLGYLIDLIHDTMCSLDTAVELLEKAEKEAKERGR